MIPCSYTEEEATAKIHNLAIQTVVKIENEIFKGRYSSSTLELIEARIEAVLMKYHDIFISEIRQPTTEGEKELREPLKGERRRIIATIREEERLKFEAELTAFKKGLMDGNNELVTQLVEKKVTAFKNSVREVIQAGIEGCDYIFQGKKCSERKFCSGCGKGYRKNSNQTLQDILSSPLLAKD